MQLNNEHLIIIYSESVSTITFSVNFTLRIYDQRTLCLLILCTLLVCIPIYEMPYPNIVTTQMAWKLLQQIW